MIFLYLCFFCKIVLVRTNSESVYPRAPIHLVKALLYLSPLKLGGFKDWLAFEHVQLFELECGWSEESKEEQKSHLWPVSHRASR